MCRIKYIKQNFFRRNFTTKYTKYTNKIFSVFYMVLGSNFLIAVISFKNK